MMLTLIIINQQVGYAIIILSACILENKNVNIKAYVDILCYKPQYRPTLHLKQIYFNSK